MLDAKRITDVQSKRSAKVMGVESVEREEQIVIQDCRKYIQEFSDMYRNLAPEKKKDVIREKINSYVMSTLPIIKGYVDEDNRPDTNKLIDMLVEEIMDYGILSDAMRNPEVYEIRGNGKGIKIEKAGKITDLMDGDGNIIEFDSVEQQETILRKFMGDVRLNPKYAVMNGRTIEGYRIAAVHSSGMSPDPSDPNGEMFHGFVLRKFRKSKMNLSQIVSFGTMSDNMARFLALLPAGGLTFVTVGPTASGKTTLNNAILQDVPPTTRTVLLQNPSEIDLRMRDSAGRIYNDVIHLEAQEKEDPLPSDPTMVNLMNHILRLSPTFVCFGELRTNKEFKLGMQIAQAGHPINCTFHAESSEGAIRRFLTAYLAESGNEPSHLALDMMTELVNIIIVQKIMRDGRRKVIQISEVIGVNPENNNEPMINDLYMFDIDREPEYDVAGNLVEIKGTHRRVGKLSDKCVRKFKLEGVPEKKFAFLTKDVDNSEVEAYTGNVKSS